MTTCIYTRISADPTGQRAGVNRQLEDCQKRAAQLGHTVVAHYDDNDISAYSGKRRPDFEKMLTAMQRGEIKAVIVWHYDRLYRNPKDLERVIDIAEATGTQLESVVAGAVDLSTPQGRLQARIGVAVARHESEHKAERQRAANAHRRNNGQWQANGKAPWGYERIGEPGHYTLTPVEPFATMIKTAAADVLRGVSLNSICGDWNRQGVTRTGGGKWIPLSLRQMLLNPTYAAMTTEAPSGDDIRYHRKGAMVCQGNWPAIIDIDTHRALVGYLTDPSRRTYTFNRAHMGSGVYVCGVCGKKLYSIGSANTARKYGCINGKRHLARKAELIDDRVEKMVLAVLSESDIRNYLAPDATVDVGALTARRTVLNTRLQQTLDNLTDMQMAGTIDGQEHHRQYQRAKDKYSQEIDGLTRQIDAAAATSPALHLVDKADDNDKLRELWNDAPPAARGAIIDELMTVTVLPSGRQGKLFDPNLIDIRPTNKVAPVFARIWPNLYGHGALTATAYAKFA